MPSRVLATIRTRAATRRARRACRTWRGLRQWRCRCPVRAPGELDTPLAQCGVEGDRVQHPSGYAHFPVASGRRPGTPRPSRAEGEDGHGVELATGTAGASVPRTVVGRTHQVRAVPAPPAWTHQRGGGRDLWADHRGRGPGPVS